MYIYIYIYICDYVHYSTLHYIALHYITLHMYMYIHMGWCILIRFT